MIYNVYAIRDIKTAFAQPILDNNDETAIRNFRAQCLNASVNPTLFYTPEDFQLYRIGEYDTDSGEIKPIVPPKHVVDASSFKDEE